MQPLLHPGDWIEVEWFSDSNSKLAKCLNPGDVVVGRHGEGDWIVHRYVGLDRARDNELLVKGDTSLAWDNLKRDQIWGRVKAIRKSESAPARPLRTTRVDLLIANCLRWTVPETTVRAKIARRLVFLLSTAKKVWPL